MSESILARIEREAVKLPVSEQLKLIEKLIHQMREKTIPGPKELSWQKLYGRGRGLWGGEDAQIYVNRMREERF